MLIRKRVAEGRYSDAAQQYMIGPLPTGEMYKGLVEPLKIYDPDPIRALISLPFHGIVTTNWDGSMHDAWGGRIRHQAVHSGVR
jgi:hypothetical protein